MKSARFNQKLGANIAFYRQVDNLTQRELGLLCKPPLRRVTINAIENGYQRVFADTLMAIGEALGRMPNELLRGCDKP